MDPSSENTSETETKTQGQKRKTSKLAIAAVVLGAVGLCTVVLVFLLDNTRGIQTSTWTLARNISVLLAGVGFVSAIIAMRQMKKSNEMLKRRKFAVLGIVLATAVFVTWVSKASVLYYLDRLTPLSRPLCGSHLSSLGKAMMAYANNHDGKYPTANKWCDLLIQGNYTAEKQFVCPSSEARRGQSSYALNKNIVGMKVSDISPDVVLLFESKTGWNQFGGPELLAPEHHGGKGCNILFNDGHVDFVRIKRLGELKWK